MQSIKVKRIKSNAVLPKRATDGAAGADLYACIDKPVTIESGDLVMIPTGIAIELPTKEMAGFVFARSGLGIKHGICPSNAVGVIDSDYRGEICVGLTNHGKEPFIIEPQTRIAQLIVMPVIPFETEETEELGATMRGGSGFGSTGL
ncbi:MAG: dUTP diphosphatase [Acutalibacteraceae bacterium]|nr:dUTP diphosphatase [Acutalibacteraceae bacterium]